MLSVRNYLRNPLYVCFWVMVLVKKDIVVMICSHNLKQSELIKIDPFEEPTHAVSPIIPKPVFETTSERTTIKTPPVADTPPQSTTTTETPPVTILEATSTGNQPSIMITQSSPEVVAVPPLNSLHELMSCTEADCDLLWQGAMAEELTALHQTHTWDLVLLPLGKRAIGSRWVYKIKTMSDGSIERYKARLVTKVSCCQWKISQLDVKNAFLNGDLNKEVYMTPPPSVPHQSCKVCKLQKALYGLKQAPCAWYEKFFIVVTSLGFVSSHHDSALFNGIELLKVELLKAELSHRFAMKDLGLLRYFLGIDVASSPKGYLLSQSKYIVDLFDRVIMTDNKIDDIPLDGKYTPIDGDPLPDPSLYHMIVGSLVYFTVTRPDIAYVVHIVRTIISFHIFLDLRAYYDSDWAGDSVTRKSTTKFCVFLRDSLISWKSKKQDVLSRSSTEAKYRVMAVTTSEIVWLCWLLTDMGVHITSPTPLYVVTPPKSDSSGKVTGGETSRHKVQVMKNDLKIETF
ncbi:uncharacterized mitochondrial protein-like protein [Tanacetum coccineum]